MHKHGGAADVDVDADANKFLNQGTGEVTIIHPGTNFIVQQLADARRFASIMGSDLSVMSLPGSGAWMRFARLPKNKQGADGRVEGAPRRFSSVSSKSGGSRHGDGAAGESGGAGAGTKEGETTEDGEGAGPEEFWYDFETDGEAAEPPVDGRLVPYPPSPSTDQAAVLAVRGGH